MTVKALLSSRGLIQSLDTAALERGLFAKSNDKDIYDSLSVLLPHILRILRTILRVIDINTTILNHIRVNMQTCIAKDKEDLWYNL